MVQDYGQIGNSLRQRDVQYVANRDEYGIWRILDTWHSEMSAMTLTDNLEIPDDSNAVLVLKEGQFLALMKEVEQQGYMPARTSSEEQLFRIAKEENSTSREAALEKDLVERVKEINQLHEALTALQKEKNSSSEKHELSMRKLELFETMSNKGNLELDIAELLKSLGD